MQLLRPWRSIPYQLLVSPMEYPAINQGNLFRLVQCRILGTMLGLRNSFQEL